MQYQMKLVYVKKETNEKDIFLKFNHIAIFFFLNWEKN